MCDEDYLSLLTVYIISIPNLALIRFRYESAPYHSQPIIASCLGTPGVPNKYAVLLRMYNDLLFGHATFHGTFNPPSRNDTIFRPVKF